MLPLLAVNCFRLHSMTKTERLRDYQATAVDKHLKKEELLIEIC